MPTFAASTPTRRAILRKGWQTGTAIATVSLLSACGFELRKAPELAFSTL